MGYNHRTITVIMINNKFSRILIVTLYFVILASHFALSAYNDGREYEGRDNCHELAGADGYFCIDRDCEGLPKGAQVQIVVSIGE